MFVLAVHVDQVFAELAQHLDRHRPAVDETARGLVGLDHAPQQALPVLEQVVFLEPFGGIVRRLQREAGGNLGARATVADHVAVGAAAQHQRQRVDENGLARAGFAREHREPRLEAQFQLADDGEIADVQNRENPIFRPQCSLMRITSKWLRPEGCTSSISVFERRTYTRSLSSSMKVDWPSKEA